MSKPLLWSAGWGQRRWRWRWWGWCLSAQRVREWGGQQWRGLQWRGQWLGRGRWLGIRSGLLQGLSSVIDVIWKDKNNEWCPECYDTGDTKGVTVSTCLLKSLNKTRKWIWVWFKIFVRQRKGDFHLTKCFRHQHCLNTRNLMFAKDYMPVTGKRALNYSCTPPPTTPTPNKKLPSHTSKWGFLSARKWEGLPAACGG